MNYRYGRYVYGPDPLAMPYDVRGAVDAMGDSVLSGSTPRDALRDLLRRGLSDDGRRGLNDLLRQLEKERTGAYQAPYYFSDAAESY